MMVKQQVYSLPTEKMYQKGKQIQQTGLMLGGTRDDVSNNDTVCKDDVLNDIFYTSLKKAWNKLKKANTLFNNDQTDVNKQNLKDAIDDVIIKELEIKKSKIEPQTFSSLACPIHNCKFVATLEEQTASQEITDSVNIEEKSTVDGDNEGEITGYADDVDQEDVDGQEEDLMRRGKQSIFEGHTQEDILKKKLFLHGQVTHRFPDNKNKSIVQTAVDKEVKSLDEQFSAGKIKMHRVISSKMKMSISSRLSTTDRKYFRMNELTPQHIKIFNLEEQLKQNMKALKEYENKLLKNAPNISLVVLMNVVKRQLKSRTIEFTRHQSNILYNKANKLLLEGNLHDDAVVSKWEKRLYGPSGNIQEKRNFRKECKKWSPRYAKNIKNVNKVIKKCIEEKRRSIKKTKRELPGLRNKLRNDTNNKWGELTQDKKDLYRQFALEDKTRYRSLQKKVKVKAGPVRKLQKKGYNEHAILYADMKVMKRKRHRTNELLRRQKINKMLREPIDDNLKRYGMSVLSTTLKSIAPAEEQYGGSQEEYKLIKDIAQLEKGLSDFENNKFMTNIIFEGESINIEVASKKLDQNIMKLGSIKTRTISSYPEFIKTAIESVCESAKTKGEFIQKIAEFHVYVTQKENKEMQKNIQDVKFIPKILMNKSKNELFPTLRAHDRITPPQNDESMAKRHRFVSEQLADATSKYKSKLINEYLILYPRPDIQPKKHSSRSVVNSVFLQRLLLQGREEKDVVQETPAAIAPPPVSHDHITPEPVVQPDYISYKKWDFNIGIDDNNAVWVKLPRDGVNSVTVKGEVVSFVSKHLTDQMKHKWVKGTVQKIYTYHDIQVVRECRDPHCPICQTSNNMNMEQQLIEEAAELRVKMNDPNMFTFAKTKKLKNFFTNLVKKDLRRVEAQIKKINDRRAMLPPAHGFQRLHQGIVVALVKANNKIYKIPVQFSTQLRYKFTNEPITEDECAKYKKTISPKCNEQPECKWNSQARLCMSTTKLKTPLVWIALIIPRHDAPAIQNIQDLPKPSGLLGLLLDHVTMLENYGQVPPPEQESSPPPEQESSPPASFEGAFESDDDSEDENNVFDILSEESESNPEEQAEESDAAIEDTEKDIKGGGDGDSPTKCEKCKNEGTLKTKIKNSRGGFRTVYFCSCPCLEDYSLRKRE